MSAPEPYLARVRQRREECLAMLAGFGPELERDIAAAAALLRARLDAGGRVFACGNGGSAAQASHFAAELVGRFGREREPLAAFCLGSDVPTLTALANDRGYDQALARQLGALARAGDALVAVSTSGRSANVVAAARAGRALGVHVVALTGRDGGELAAAAELAIRVPSDATPRIQEGHLLVLHTLAELVEG